jgi:hypothetical protein
LHLDHNRFAGRRGAGFKSFQPLREFLLIIACLSDEIDSAHKRAVAVVARPKAMKEINRRLRKVEVAKTRF